MKLAAIYNVWDGLELLEASIRSIRDHVDVVIVVYQKTSNWGEDNPDINGILLGAWMIGGVDILVQVEPGDKFSQRDAMKHETKKRQAGINKAIELGCTHFIGMDSDECYKPEEFLRAKEIAKTRPTTSFAAPIRVYYKHPTLCLKDLDETYVPFICPLPAKTGIRKTNLLIDPTRRTTGNYEIMPNITMHHYSWVRENGIEGKLRNSTARKNIYQDDIISEYREAGEGTTLRYVYPGQVLVRCKNEFGITDWEREKERA